MVVQTSLVCETRDSVATIVASSAFTCFQEILTEVDEVNENIQEILTEVDENGDNIQEIIDMKPIGSGWNFKWNEKKQDIHCNIDCFHSNVFVEEVKEIIVLKR